MFVLATALKMFVPVLLQLGSADLWTVIKGLGLLAGAFILFGVLGPAVGVGLAILGAGMILLGTGLLLAGGGAILFASALTVLASSGAAAAAVVTSVVNSFLKDSKEMANNFRAASVNWANAIRASAPAWIRAATAIILSFLRSAQKLMPEFGKTLLIAIRTGLSVIRGLIPDFVTTGFAILMGFLRGLNRNIGRITDQAVEIVVRFLDGIEKQMDRIVRAGTRLVVSLIEAIARQIGRSTGNLVSSARDIAGDLVDGLVNGLSSMWGRVTGWLDDQINRIPGPIRKALGISSPSKVFAEIGKFIALGLAVGIRDNAPDATKEAEAMGEGALDTMRATMSGISDALAMDPNLSPTVTPVLDLTKMANDANRIGALLATAPLQAGLSYSAAASLAAQQDEFEFRGGGDGGDVVFEQHWHTPKAPDRTTVYRTTRNQIAMARKELGVE